MRGKHLLQVLAMAVPGLLLIVLMVFSLLPSADVMVAPPDAEFVFTSASMEKSEGQDAPIRARPQIATQKRMRDPWEKPEYAKTSSAPRAEQRCDASVSNQEAPCFYW